jgi:hypothetical protein
MCVSEAIPKHPNVESVDAAGKVKDQTSNQRGRSEWELIKNFLEGDGFSNKSNTAWPNHFFDSTTQGQDHVATRVLLVIGANTHQNLLEERSGTRNSSSY